MRRPCLFAVLLLLLLMPLSASAQMTLISENRYLDATAEIYDDNSGDSFGWSEFSAAESFGPYFDNFFVSPSEFFGYADSEASHESTLNPDGFLLSGYAYTDGELFEMGYTLFAHAESHFEVTFSIAEAQDWSLNGTIEADANGLVEMSLVDGIGNPVWFLSWSNNSLPLLVTEGGTLAPDTYTLEITAVCYEDLFDTDFYVASQAIYDLEFAVTGGTSPVGDSLALGRYLNAGPNPMQNKTTIAFAGVADQGVELDVYDVRGRLVRSLMSAGSSRGQVAWDGRDSSGQNVPQGIYFVRMRDGQEFLQRKVTVIR